MIVLNLILSLLLTLSNPVKIEKPNDKPIEVVSCDSKTYKDKILNTIPSQFTYLKSYTLDGQGGGKPNIEYSYIFSKNTTYLVMIANSSPQTKGLKVTIYDSNRKQLVTSVTQAKYYPAIMYKCNATGIYFLRFTFENSNDYCGGSVLAFKR
jgi:hypothetical protein